jgi:hypothetical protein
MAATVTRAGPCAATALAPPAATQTIDAVNVPSAASASFWSRLAIVNPLPDRSRSLRWKLLSDFRQVNAKKSARAYNE